MTDTLARLRAGELAGATRLTLRADLTEFPEELYSLADSLEILDLSGNRLTRLPADLGRLHRLRILFCSGNPFTELPEVLGTLPNLEMIGFKACQLERVSAAALPPRLRWLILTDNRIAELPAALGERPALQKLMLAGNRLEALPASMADLHQLELLRLSANRFAALPPAILALPRLTWLAYGDNPLGAERERAVRTQAARQQRIAWSDLALGERLGEGASGIIHQARWQSPTGPREVAVKLFKGSMTSDGTPESESAASLSAGTHPWLIGALGDLAEHPEQRSGLVLELVEPAFGNLAGPPSFTTCSRDVYPEGTRFTAAAVREMAGGMASALAHLHGHGLVHGDFYAHNILWDGGARCLLGDFGGASLLPEDAAQAARLQRFESRAFGILLEEWLTRCSEPVDPALAALAAECQQPDLDARPLLAEVAQRLQG
ncbi:leucine-rich repeat-containing protein kinase family protein [Pseudomonas oryzihabitans]|uniref:leucine-rich repeat-containing protein kinase family protein n=1 Tax=Pseudomonas oryzihabitans TaxID=47885 RepID=UPI00135E6FA5|nr:leucine-rich repeat-containing protein kinase family protein [Pseudomonas oryzihabitans]MXS20363.1 protein kinase [Pseudomonas oryzihabitans]